EDGGRLTLLDAGLPGYWNRLLREVRAMGRRLEDIDAVLVTHSHPDHAGFAERARKEAGATVYAHRLDAPELRGAVVSGPPAFLNESSALALESLSRLEGLRGDILLPGHGEPWRGGISAAVEIARAAAAAAGVTAPTRTGSARASSHAH